MLELDPSQLRSTLVPVRPEPNSKREEGHLMVAMQLVTLILEAILFGAFVISYSRAKRILGRDTTGDMNAADSNAYSRRAVPGREWLLWGNFIMLMLATMHMCVVIAFTLDVVLVDDDDYRAIVEVFYGSTSLTVGKALMSTYVSEQLILDAFLIHRLYMTCGRRWWIVSSFGLMFVLAAMHGFIAASECGMRLCGVLEFGYLAGMEMFHFLSFQAHTIVCGFIVIALLRQKFWVAQAKPSLSGSAHIHMILECFVGSAVPYVTATFMLLMFVFYPGPEEVLFRTAIMAASPFLGLIFSLAITQRV